MLIKHLQLLIGPPFSIELHAEVPCQQRKYLNTVNVTSDSYSLPVLGYNQQDCLDPGQNLLKCISFHTLKHITSISNAFVCYKA